MLGKKFEHHKEPLAPRHVFLSRASRYALFALALILFSLVGGAAGYHFLEGLGWLDSFLNASMILTGMGPVDRLQNEGAKVFAVIYSLFSGVIFLSSSALLLAPWVHRFLHRIHVEEKAKES